MINIVPKDWDQNLRRIRAMPEGDNPLRFHLKIGRDAGLYFFMVEDIDVDCINSFIVKFKM